MYQPRKFSLGRRDFEIKAEQKATEWTFGAYENGKAVGGLKISIDEDLLIDSAVVGMSEQLAHDIMEMIEKDIRGLSGAETLRVLPLKRARRTYL
jgi:hypothetical protein